MIAIVGAWIAMTFRPPNAILVLQKKMHTSAQLPVRVSILVLAALVFIARRFGLDNVASTIHRRAPIVPQQSRRGAAVPNPSPRHHGAPRFNGSPRRSHLHH